MWASSPFPSWKLPSYFDGSRTLLFARGSVGEGLPFARPMPATPISIHSTSYSGSHAIVFSPGQSGVSEFDASAYDQAAA